MSRRRSKNVLRLTPEQAAELGVEMTRDLARGNVVPNRDVKPDKFAPGRARRVQGDMTGPERARARELEADRIAGRIQAWDFEPVRFLLGDRLNYTPDFLIVDAEGFLTADEVKGTGGWLDAKSRTKWKTAGERYRWLRFRALVERKKAERTAEPLGRWHVEIYKPVQPFPGVTP